MSDRNPQNIQLGDRVQHKWHFVYDRLRGFVAHITPILWGNGGWAQVHWDDETTSQSHTEDLVKVMVLDQLAELG
jgi:hypothetical protein